MTLASDQNAGPDDLSTTSRRMLELREAVLAEWERRVRTSVKEAHSLSHPVLIDTLPALYENLTQALSPNYPRTSAAVATPSVAIEHGAERARLTNYEAQAVISEYQIFRSTIIDVLTQNNVQLSDGEMQIISSSIDACIREAVNAFALAQAVLRERFIAVIVHDVRNPLATASAAAQLIPLTTDISKKDNLANKITENLSRIDEMIHDLLDTVLFQSGERLRLRLTSFDIEEVAQEVCEQAVAAHGPRFAILGTSIIGWWDRNAIKRALENLVDNAVKYGAPDKPIQINFQTYHGRLLLSVHNDGDPIPPEQVESVFQVFRRAKAAREGGKQGWGLGLPMVRSVAESHGGSIDLDSSTERGTTFSIDIPIDARPFQNAPTLE